MNDWLTSATVKVSRGILLSVVAGSFSFCLLAEELPAPLAPPAGTNSDLILLENGEAISGAFQEQTLTLRTAYGSLVLDKSVLSSLEMEHGDVVARVTTVNSNRLSGLVENQRFAFQPVAGPRMEFRREKISRVLFKQNGKELPRGRWIRLNNGDCLSGDLLLDSLVLAETNGRTTFGLKELAAFSFPSNGNLVTVSLRNGQSRQGTIELQDFPVRLDVGPKLLLYQGQICSINDTSESSASAVPVSSDSARPGAPLALVAEPTNVCVWIPSGEFVMGSPSEEPGRDPDEGPQTKVFLPRGFWMAKCEVTQGEYQRIMGANPSNNTGEPSRPVEKVNWFEAVDFCSKLTQAAETAGTLPKGFAFRLPTEAEWEYACRAGSRSRFAYGDDGNAAKLEDYAWFSRNSSSVTHPVGTRLPNAWGLFDLHGNVWEWCLDRWEDALPGGSITNVPVPARGNLRVTRGGSWLYDSKACRCANRDDYSPWNRCSDIGFRVVLARDPMKTD